MSFVGGLLLEMPVQIQESGPLASPHVRESADCSGPTTEPISLGWKDIAINEVLDIAVACSQEDWDGSGSAPISQEATFRALSLIYHCLLYTSDAADERSSVDLGGRRIIKKKNNEKRNNT